MTPSGNEKELIKIIENEGVNSLFYVVPSGIVIESYNYLIYLVGHVSDENDEYVAYQLIFFDSHPKVLADAYQKEFGYVDLVYIEQITSSLLSIHTNKLYFNLNTFFMFLTLSIFISFSVVLTKKLYFTKNL